MKKNLLISEDHYAASMHDVVLPFLMAHGQSGFFEPVPGQKLYYEHYSAQEPKGILVMLHGFSEVIEKFRELVYYFLKQGYHVWQLQQREHGLSYRSTQDPDLIYLEDARWMVRDLRAFYKDVIKKDPETRKRYAGKRLPIYLYAHSMGGGIGALYIESFPRDFAGAVLSSPMLELNSAGTPMWMAKAYAKVMCLMGKGQTDMPGSHPFSEDYDLEGSGTNSAARYAYWHEIQKSRRDYQMCVPALRTGLTFLEITKQAGTRAHCQRIQAPVLLLQAGQDTMVNPGGQENFITQLGDKGRLVRFARAKHEIYRCSDDILKEYLDTIFGFFGDGRGNETITGCACACD